MKVHASERLLELVNSSKEDICKAVASNPNTAPDLLIQLFREYPVEVLNNQALDLILLEIPNFLEQLCQSNYAVRRIAAKNLQNRRWR